MSHPKEPEPVKLICSLFSAEEDLIHWVIGELEEFLGPVDWKSPPLFFDKSRFYEPEMGWPLHRRFVSFRDLIGPGQIVDIKLKTNEIEARYSLKGRRRINIDPGYVAPERFILATGKNYTHRIYLDRGIYADLTLIYRKGSYRPLEWTYPDYASLEFIRLFNEIRMNYMKQLREGGRLAKEHDRLW